MRKRVWLGLAAATLVVAMGGGALAFGPLVRAQAAGQAERRGLILEIVQVRPGWGRVWLRNVALRVPDVPAVEVELDAVEVMLGASLQVKAVRAHGGTVRVRGSPREVADQVAAWRAKRPSASGDGAGTSSIVAEGIGVVWEEAEPGADPQLAWGLSYERKGDEEHVGVDLARASYHGLELEVQRGELVLGRRDGKRVIQKLTSEGAFARVQLGSDISEPSAWQVNAGDGAGSAAAGVEAQRGTDGAPYGPRGGGADRGAPSLAPNRAKGAPEASAPEHAPTFGTAAKLTPLQEKGFSRFIDAGRPDRVRNAIARAATWIGDLLPEQGELDLAGLRLQVRRGSENLNVGPARLRVLRGNESVSIALLPAPSAEAALRVSLELPLVQRDVTANIDGGPVSLAALGIHEGDFGLTALDKASLEAHGNAVLSADGKTASWTGSARLLELSLQQKWLAPGPVRGLTLGISGRGTIALDGRAIRIQKSEIEIGKVHAELRGELEQTEQDKKIYLDGAVPLASCQAMLDSAPIGLMPLLTGTRMTGTFALTAHVELDTRFVDKMITRWSMTNECRISETLPAIAPRKFASSWTREVLDANGRPTLMQFGPGTPTWVPRAEISKHMETAVLICEDGAFFRHHGFDEEAIRNSIRENVRAGHFVRGASTISMQLAKNLYLPKEKTLSRKLQEAVLTMLLEQELTKDQIMELYLNVIEFGPGIYGIGPAAAYYFNTTASQLSLGQSLYLASILPNPKRQYFGADGAVTPGWSRYLRKLMRIAAKIHRVTEQELEDGLAEQVTFKVPHSPRTAPQGEEDDVEGASRPPLESEQTVE